MDNNFKFKTKQVSIGQLSSSVVNSFASSVELIPAMVYKLTCDTIQKSENNSVFFDFYDVNMSTKSKTDSTFARFSFGEFFKTWRSCNHIHFL